MAAAILVRLIPQGGTCGLNRGGGGGERTIESLDRSKVVRENCVQEGANPDSIRQPPSDNLDELEGVERRRVRYANTEGIFTCALCELEFVSLYPLHEHMIGTHSDSLVEYVCAECEYVSMRPHGLKCHIPKCKGKTVLMNVELEFSCEACERSFATKRGRSQHERHAHPTVRNAKRATTRLRRVRKTDPQIGEGKPNRQRLR